jgi:hypothetical protein
MGGARTRNLHRMKMLRYPLRYPGEETTRFPEDRNPRETLNGRPVRKSLRVRHKLS